VRKKGETGRGRSAAMVVGKWEVEAGGEGRGTTNHRQATKVIITKHK